MGHPIVCDPLYGDGKPVMLSDIKKRFKLSKHDQEERPMLNRVPDSSMIINGQGDKAEHIEAFRDSGNTYSMFYLPVGKTITVNLSLFQKKINAWWFNPKDGSYQKINSMESIPGIKAR